MKTITLTLLMAISIFSFAQLNGTYTIGGTSPNYPTINDAVSDLISQGISGNVIFNIRPGTYNEQIMIPRINGTENLNTIKFQSETNNADDVIITYSPTTSTDNYTVLLDNSRNIIFMFLTFTSEQTTSGYSKIITLINGSYGFNFFTNKVLGINDTEAEYGSRLPFSTSPNTIDTLVDIEENYFSGSYKGYLSLNKIENLTFSNNTMIDDCSTTWQTGCTISEISGDNANISNNEITGYVNINYCTVSELYIQQNKFIDGGYCRIYFASSDSVYFKNNFLIKTRLVLQSSSNINIYHNSSLTENSLESIYVYDNATGVRIKNNNLIQRDGEYGTYCIKIEDIASISEMDYNNIFSEGGSVVHIAAMYLETTADWFAVSGFDEHSYTNNVNYIDDNSDLHLCETNIEMTGIGGLVTKDYDNVLRSTIAPTVGAVELNSYIPILNLGENSTICKGADITLDAGTFQSYQWNNGANSQTITVSDTGNYVVTITDGTSCHISDSIQISNFNYYLELGNDTSICDGETLILDAGNFETYLWNNNSLNQTIDVTTQGQYSIEVTDTNSCTYNDTINITISPVPTVNLGNDTSICDGEYVEVSAGAGGTYLWNTGETDQIILVYTAGTYSVEYTNVYNCSAYDTVSIGVNQLPTVNLGNDTTICEGETLTLDAGNGFISYEWNNGSTSQTLDITSSTIASVTIIDDNACENSDTINVDFVICSGINKIGEKYTISLYPNPAKNQLTINSENIVINNLQILNITGKTIKQLTINNEQPTIDISDLQNGVYFLKINNIETLKFIKE